MLAFSGAGIRHALFLVGCLGIRDIIIPPGFGSFSAMGLILIDFRHDFIRSVMKQASEVDPKSIWVLFKDMGEESVRDFTKRTLRHRTECKGKRTGDFTKKIRLCQFIQNVSIRICVNSTTQSSDPLGQCAT